MIFCSVPAAGSGTITVASERQRATSFNPVNAAHFLSSRVTSPLTSQGDNCWSGDAQTGSRRGEGKGGGLPGEKERAGTRVGRPGMFEHSRGKKTFLEFKVTELPPSNTWITCRFGTNGIKESGKLKRRSRWGPLCVTPPPRHHQNPLSCSGFSPLLVQA